MKNSFIAQLNNVFSLFKALIATSSGRRHINSIFLIFQSRLFTWSVRMAPEIFRPSGINTSNGYPFTWLVTGQNIASPTFLLYSRGDKTKAGRLPACSCPACGLKLSHTISPRSGTCVFWATISLFPQEPRYQSRDEYFSL